MFGSSSVTPFVHVMLGTNDANSSTSAATYGTNLASLVASLLSSGYKVVISYPPYCPAFTAAKNALLQAYQGQIDTIVNANPGVVFHGVTGAAWGQSLNSPEMFYSDNIHFNDYGYSMWAGSLAAVFANLFGQLNYPRVIGG
jgi:lysophospholipase L1-like esterase